MNRRYHQALYNPNQKYLIADDPVVVGASIGPSQRTVLASTLNLSNDSFFSPKTTYPLFNNNQNDYIYSCELSRILNTFYENISFIFGQTIKP